jgi:hypothetical protein
MDWTGVANNPTFQTTFIYAVKVYGSAILDPGMTVSSLNLEFSGSGTGNIINSAGHLIGGILINATGSWSLAADLNAGGIQVYQGTFNTANYDITATSFAANGIANAIFIDMGTSTITVEENYMAFDPAVTINSSNADIVFDNQNGPQVFVQLANAVFNNVTCLHSTYFLGNLQCVNFDAQAGVFINNLDADHAQFAVSSEAGTILADTLLFGANVLSFAFDVITVNDVFAASANCTSTLSLKPYVTSPASFIKASGTVTLDYTYLNSISASGGATFIANNSWDLGNNSGWSINAAAPRDLYWVGGTGQWNDATHWATSSGGAGGNCQPGANDNAIFDALSFTQSGDSIFVNPGAGVYCHDLTFNGIPAATVLHSSSSVTPCYVSGSATFPPELDLYSLNMEMTASDPGNTLTSGGNNIMRLNFRGTGEWTLQDELNTGNFKAGGGILHTNNFNINTGDVNIGGSVVLDLGTSTISTLGFYTSNVNYTILGSNANLVITGSFLGISVWNATFNSITFQGTAHASGNLNCNFLYAQGEFTDINSVINAGYASFDDNVTLANNFTAGTMVLNNPGNLVRISNVTINTDLISYGTSGFPIQIEGINGAGTITKSSGQVCLDNVLIKDITATGGAQFFAGSNGVNLGGNSGWTFAPCIPPLTDVWPGDANYDLTADNNDILNIGLAFSYTGPVRAGASTAWVAQPATDWSAQFANGANLKHADTDGSGLVDLDDTLAVSLNYGMMHPPRLMPQVVSSLPPPALYTVTNPDTVSLSDTVEVDIYLGTSSVPVDSIYGIAFTLNFDSTLVSNSYLGLDFSNCWMGVPQVDLITFHQNMLSQGRIDMALVRTDQQNINGFGLLGRLGIVIVDNVGAKVTMPITISDITALTASEILIPVSTVLDSVVIDTAATVGIHQPIAELPVTIYPNPVQDQLYIHAGSIITSYEIQSAAGRLVSQQNVDNENIYINTSKLAEGVYFIRILSDAGVAVRKIEVLRN